MSAALGFGAYHRRPAWPDLLARPQRCGRRQAGHDGLFSGGAVATLPASGADSRIKAAVPLSGVLAWDEAVRSPQAWQHALLSQAGLSSTANEWITLQRDLIAPTAALAGTSAALLLVNGSSDEFFPLNAHLATLAGLPTGSRVRSPIANFDHGCYKLTGGESASTIEARATLHAEGGQRAFFRHHPLADPAYPSIPNPPTVGAGALGSTTYVTARVDRPAGLSHRRGSRVVEQRQRLPVRQPAAVRQGRWPLRRACPLPLSSATAYFVDVQYRTAGLFAQRFAVSSAPILGSGFCAAHSRHQHLPLTRQRPDYGVFGTTEQAPDRQRAGPQLWLSGLHSASLSTLRQSSSRVQAPPTAQAMRQVPAAQIGVPVQVQLLLIAATHTTDSPQERSRRRSKARLGPLVHRHRHASRCTAATVELRLHAVRVAATGSLGRGRHRIGDWPPPRPTRQTAQASGSPQSIDEVQRLGFGAHSCPLRRMYAALLRAPRASISGSSSRVSPGDR